MSRPARFARACAGAAQRAAARMTIAQSFIARPSFVGLEAGLLLILLDDEVLQRRVARVAYAVLLIRGAVEARVRPDDSGLPFEVELGLAFEDEEELVLRVAVRRVRRLADIDDAQLQRAAVYELLVGEPVLVARPGLLDFLRVELVDAVLDCVSLLSSAPRSAAPRRTPRAPAEGAGRAARLSWRASFEILRPGLTCRGSLPGWE